MTSRRTPGPRITVLGLGSVLQGDDAFGPWVLARLAAHWELPEGVELLDAGTPGPELGHYLLGLDALVVVDTVRAGPAGGGKPPGTLLRYRRDEILKHPPQPRMSPHDPSLKDALATAEMAGQPLSEVLLVGAVPESTELGTGLSDAVRGALDGAEEAVVEELHRLGAAVARRDEPLPLDVWWETGGRGRSEG
jgi:hydrogenase maturation protease